MSLSESNTASYYRVYAPIFEKIESFIPRQITPNMISCASFVLLTALFLSKSYYNPYIFSFCLFIYWILDNIDGIHARNTKQTSSLGEILDHCGDAYYTIIILYMFFNVFRINIPKLFIVLTGIFMNLKHLLSFYTHDFSLKLIDLPKLGIEFGVDDLLLLLTFLPLLTLIKTPVKTMQRVVYVLYAILGIASIQMVMALPTLNPMYLLGTIMIPILYYFIINLPLLIGALQALISLYFILHRSK